jgi:hypothetical protein
VEKCRYFLLSFEYTLINYLFDFFLFFSQWLNELFALLWWELQVVSSRLNLTESKPGNSDERKISNKLYQFFIFLGD